STFLYHTICAHKYRNKLSRSYATNNFAQYPLIRSIIDGTKRILKECALDERALKVLTLLNISQ
ncbi:hypothetical protein Trydic_g11995, partial [Trypoxylus dichotomus]